MLNLRHLLLWFSGHHSSINDERYVYNTLLSACHNSGCWVCTTAKHEFHPQGFSAAVIIGESHVTIHTWPEQGKIAVNYCSCAEEPNFQAFIKTWCDAGFEILSQEIVSQPCPTT